MKRLVIGILAGMLAAGAQTKDEAERLLKAARNVELVDGNLAAAIRQYDAIIAKYRKTDRAVTATALVRKAECLQKQGDAGARKIYEQVVKDYADQKDAVALAKARLGGGSSVVSYRQVWAGPEVEIGGTVSPDGRYLSHVDWDTGDLALRDLVANADRRLTDKGTWTQSQEFAEESVISKDGKHVVYNWYNGKDHYDLRIANLPVSGFLQPRRLFDNEDFNWIAPYDLSPDGAWVAVAAQRRGGALQIGLVSTRDGSLRVLKSVASGVERMFFFPDGKYLGFDLAAAEDSSRDVFVLAVDGSSENRAAVGPSQEVMMGWSPDGGRLLFASDRRGSMGLWAVPIAQGRPAGTPELIRPDLPWWSLGVTSSGALYLGATISNWDIQVASLDFETGKLLSPPAKPIQAFMGSNRQPDWSRDGKFLAYVRSGRGRSDAGDRVLAIRSLETGRTRELRPNVRLFNFPRWAPDGRSFVAQGADFSGQQGIYSIDALTGEAAPIAVAPEGKDPVRGRPQWSPDGKRIYYLSDMRNNSEKRLMELDLVSRSERELMRRNFAPHLMVSPDGPYIAARSNDPSNGSSFVLLIPTAGGEPRELRPVASTPEGHSRYLLEAWAPDSGGVIVRERLDAEGNKWGLRLIPTGGGPPRTLDLDTRDMLSPLLSPISVHPDGRQVAYVAGGQKEEVWVLENFLPAAKAATR